LKGEAPSTARPGALLPDADLDAARAEAAKVFDGEVGDAELASHLMYPKVFAEFAGAQRKYGPVSRLPTPVFFYGMTVGEEIAVEIEKGKALVVRLQAIGETDDEGQVRVFFELNGQPRIAKVPNRSVVAARPARRKADESNDGHVAAPMPGSVSSIAVTVGQVVKAGDVLLSLEAMKMETALHASRDGTVSEILVQPGSAIDAKDLLVTIA